MDARGAPPSDPEHDRLLRYARAAPPQPNTSTAQEAPPPYIAHLRSPPHSFPVLPGTAALDPLPPLEAPAFRGAPARFTGLNPVALRPIQNHPPRAQQHFPRIASQDAADRPPPPPFPTRLAPHPDPAAAAQPPQPPPQRSPPVSGTTGAPAQSPGQGASSPPKSTPAAAPAQSSTSSAPPLTDRAPRSSTPSASPKSTVPTSTAGGPTPRSPPTVSGPALAPVATLIPPPSTQPPPLPPRAAILDHREAGSSRILQSVHTLQRMPHGAPIPDGISGHRHHSPGPMLHPLQQPGSRTPSPAATMRMTSAPMHAARISPVNSRPISPMQARLSGHEQQQREFLAHAYGHKSLDSGPGRGAKGSSEAPIDVDALPADPSQSTVIRGGLPKSEPMAAQGLAGASSSRGKLPSYSTAGQHPYHIAPAGTKQLQQPHSQALAGDQRAISGIGSHLQQQELPQGSAPIHGLNQSTGRSESKDFREPDSRPGPQQIYGMQAQQPILTPSSSSLQHQPLQAGEYGGRQGNQAGIGMSSFAQSNAAKPMTVQDRSAEDANAQRSSGAPIPQSSDVAREGPPSDMLQQARADYAHGGDRRDHPEHGAAPTVVPRSVQDADTLHRAMRDSQMLEANQMRTENQPRIQGLAKQEPATVVPQPEPMALTQDQAGASSDPSGARRGQLKVEDALAYLEQVKTQFGEKLEVYNLFLDIMKAFKAQTIDTTEVIVRVSQLFLGHTSLILGFNRFLPPGYKIQIVEDEKTGALSTGFEGPKGYSSLSSQRNLNLKPIPQEKPSKRKLAAGASSPKRKETKSKNLDGFPSDVVMTPADPETTLAQSEAGRGPSSPAPTADVLSDKAAGVVSSARKAGAPSSSLPPKSAAAVNSRPRTGGAASLPMGSIPGPQAATDEERIKGFEKALSFVNSVKTRVTNPPDLFVRFMEIFSGFRNEEKTIREMYDSMAELFVDHKDLLQEFKEFLPMLHNGNAVNGNKGRAHMSSVVSRHKPAGRRTTSTAGPLAFLGPGKPKNEFAIFEYIKEKLGPQHAHIYTDFIKCVMLFTLELFSRDELLLMTADLFESHPSLNDAFTQYLEAAANNDLDEDGDDYSSVESVEPCDSATMQKYLEKPVSEIAIESTTHGTKSYRGLPRNYPKLACSGRSPLEKVTLNNRWVSVTQGSEEYSAKFMRKNSFEDNLYRCEDDRYELDMVIETNAATIMQLEPIALTMTKLPSEVKPMHALVEGALNRIHYNAIQRIYGEQGQEVVMQVKLNPSVTIPVVLARLKEKDLHWRRARNEMNRIWRDVGEKNYYKGVDHRSAVYKAFDKKELSSKMLLLDILDPAASETLRETEMARARGFAIPAGSGVVNDRSRAVRAVTNAMRNSSPSSHPLLEFEYKDDAVHRNAFDLIRMIINKDNSDVAAAKSITRCLRKLITTFYGISFDDDDASTKEAPAVMYGDEAVYAMFRLYDYLYERLAMARAGAFKLAKDQAARNEMDTKGSARVAGKTHIPELDTSPSSLVQSFSPTASQKHFAVEKLSTKGQDLYDEFLKLFKGVVTGKEDPLKFEDRCRVIIGPMCFVVFTLDKLLVKTARQISGVCGGDSVSRTFFELYQESRSRTRSAPKNAGGTYWEGMEALYCTAATAHLRKEKGEKASLFRMQYVKRAENCGLLVIHAFGKTTTDEEEKARAAETAELDAFVGFSSHTDMAASKHRKGSSGSRVENGADGGGSSRNGGNDGGKNGSGERSGGGSSKNTKRKTGGQSGQPMRKRARTSAGTRPILISEHVSKERVMDKDFVVCNELQMKINSAGQMVYVEGGSDVLWNRKRTWQRPDAKAYNEKSSRSLRVRKLLGIDEMENKKQVEKEGKMDVDSTESSSGDTSDDDVGEEDKAADAKEAVDEAEKAADDVDSGDGDGGDGKKKADDAATASDCSRKDTPEVAPAEKHDENGKEANLMPTTADAEENVDAKDSSANDAGDVEMKNANEEPDNSS